MILQWKENEADILKKSKADNGMFFHDQFLINITFMV